MSDNAYTVRFLYSHVAESMDIEMDAVGRDEIGSKEVERLM